ncbi:hypothetical protein WMY93_014743 [Mugilogobius chulae]|uniref:Ig-like domain-containing protein n=1 Tax=Mugilogobius chulae TaxID=88201 RepID=A0AAW0NW91_9GOBI
MNKSLRVLCGLILWCLLHIQDNRGQALIGSSWAIVAKVGDDVVLPCFFQPPRDAAPLTLEWTRPDLDPRFVFVWRLYEELTELKHKQFVDRAFLFLDELKNGNISLKLTNVTPKDSGFYRCFIPAQGQETSVKLIVGSSSSVQMSVAAVDQWRAEVVLQCVSEGWFPEPELWWRDSDGELLSVEHTGSLSDGLYAVRSTVNVKKSSTFSCIMSQSSTNLTEQSSMHVSETFFVLFPIFWGLTVGLVFFALVAISFAILFCLAKQRHSGSLETEQTTSTCEHKSRETHSTDSLNTQTTSPEQETMFRKLQSEFKLLEKVQEVRRQREISEHKLPVIIHSFDKWGRSVSLRKQYEEELHIKNWSVQIEVLNDQTLTYRLQFPFKLRKDDIVTIWAESCCPERKDRYNKEWEKQDPWNTGEIAVVSLYDDNNELKDIICERMYPSQHK